MYFLLDYTFLGAAQIAVYAGGITVMYIFAINLVSKRTLENLVERFKGTRVLSGALIALIGLVMVAVIVLKNNLFNAVVSGSLQEVPMQKIGESMVSSGKYGYVLPFEFISIFILACIIGGILIARKEDKK